MLSIHLVILAVAASAALIVVMVQARGLAIDVGAFIRKGWDETIVAVIGASAAMALRNDYLPRFSKFVLVLVIAYAAFRLFKAMRFSINLNQRWLLAIITFVLYSVITLGYIVLYVWQKGLEESYKLLFFEHVSWDAMVIILAIAYSWQSICKLLQKDQSQKDPSSPSTT
jgi:hypothetical protein